MCVNKRSHDADAVVVVDDVDLVAVAVAAATVRVPVVLRTDQSFLSLFVTIS